MCLSFMIFIQGRKVPLKTFFNVTSGVLVFVAAGMFTYGVHELESANIIPYYGGTIKTENNNITATRMNGDIKVFSIKDSENNRAAVVNKASKWASRIWDLNPPKNQDGTYPALHDKGAIGGLMKGLFGYNGDPSVIEVIAWVFVALGLGISWRKAAA